MCCRYSIQVAHDCISTLEELVREMWRHPAFDTNTLMWETPRRVFMGSTVNIHMDGNQHEVTPESWILATKYSVSLYLRASEIGIAPTLRKLSSPCESRVIGDSSGVLDLSKLCTIPLEQLREMPDI